MKKVLTLLFTAILILLTSALATGKENYFFIGYVPWGQLKSVSGTPEENYTKVLKSGQQITYEMNGFLTDQWEVGYGLAIEQAYDLRGYVLSVTPGFISGSFYPGTKQRAFYVKARFGYCYLGMEYNKIPSSFEYRKIAPCWGYYYSFGTGCRLPTYPRIKVEVLLVKLRAWSDEMRNFSATIHNTKLDLNFGIGL